MRGKRGRRARWVHVAIVKPGYAELIARGEKTIEMRFTRTRREPHGMVRAGDVVYFKATGGPFRAVAKVARVRYMEGLTPTTVKRLKRELNSAVRGSGAFWSEKAGARYVSVVWLKKSRVVSTGPAVPRSRGRAWWVIG